MHLLVQWIKDTPKSWSVVPREKLADGTLRQSNDLIGRTVGILWKRRTHQAIVIETSLDFGYLEQQADTLAEEQAQVEELPIRSALKRKLRDSNCESSVLPAVEPSASSSTFTQTAHVTNFKTSRAQNIQSVLESIGNDDSTNQTLPHVCLGSSDEIEEWKSKYFKTKDKLQNLRKKYKEVKEAHSQCNSDDPYENTALMLYMDVYRHPMICKDWRHPWER
ncbi:unnamed protein product [Allacma fusca]|uniref:Uncharacterized protein n=1 Tax=Allacma fusca TaxID=39272 RepID=A0A8J2NNY7_9HEXA|nr:unnamed protein product [Allacma fusca]